jgi:hypothetical protein
LGSADQTSRIGSRMGAAGGGLAERTGSMGASKGRTLVLALLLAPLMARAAQAQLWRGAAAIEVRAEDKGKPAAGGGTASRM